MRLPRHASAGPRRDRGARLGRAVVIAGFAIVAVMAFATGLLAWDAYTDRREEERDELRRQAMSAADLVERYVAVRLSVLSSLANLPAVRTGDIDAMRSSLVGVNVPELDLVGGIGFVDREGMLRGTADSFGAPVDVSDRSYVRQPLATGRPFVSEAVIGRVSDRPLVVLAAPVDGGDGDLVGVLVSSLPVTELGGVVAITPPASMQLVDRTGNVIYDDGAVDELAPPADPAALALPPGLPAVAGAGLDGSDGRVLATADVVTPEWRLVIDADADAVDGAARRTLTRELLIVATLGLVALVAAVVVGLRTALLHRAVVTQAERLASLERFTAALAVAATYDDVAGVVATLGAEVLDVERAELSAGDRAGAGPPAPEVRLTTGGGPHPPPALVATITEQATQALERVRSLHEINLLAVLSGALARATTTDEVLAAMELHGAVVESVLDVSADVAEPAPPAAARDVDATDGSPRYRAAVKPAPATPHVAAIRTGEVIEVEGAWEIRERFGAWGDAAAAAGAQSLVAVPLVLGRAPAMGAMVMTFARRGLLDARELTLVTTVGRLGAEALARARLFEQEQHVADTLQASLQPARMPVVGGWRFTGVNLAGEAGVSVGGDWYDVAVLPHGAILLSVGDVTGRGPVAAGVMGIVRAAVHALALSDRDPASILDHADRLLSSSTADQLATAWVGLLEPATGNLRHASAGHLPPLALGPTDKRYLDDAPGLLLGTGLVGRRRASSYQLELGGSIVAYTDGLCERRDESLDVALRKMSQALGDGSGIDARTVVHRVLGRATADDVVVLVATRLAEVASVSADDGGLLTAG